MYLLKLNDYRQRILRCVGRAINNSALSLEIISGNHEVFWHCCLKSVVFDQTEVKRNLILADLG